MSAIEMMDPKMDAGLASKKKLAKVTSIADALEVSQKIMLQTFKKHFFIISPEKSPQIR